MSDRAWTTFEYCWRFGVRPLMWLVRLVLVAGSVASLALLADYLTVTGVACFIAIYAVWEIGRAIRSIKPMTFNIARGEKLIVQRGASVSVPSADIKELIEQIARIEAQNRDAA